MKPGELQSIGSQKSDTTEWLNWSEPLNYRSSKLEWNIIGYLTKLPCFKADYVYTEKSLSLLLFVTKSCLTLCDPIDCCMPGFPFTHCLRVCSHSCSLSQWFCGVIFLPFHTVHGVLKARILECFAIPFFSGPYVVRTVYDDLSILGCPAWYGL